MASLKLITVFGATGAQGGSVALALAKSGRYRVRGITRNPDSDKAQPYKDAGVEMVKADTTNKDEVLKALEGAYGAYIVTDFWTLLDKEFEQAKMAVECAKEAEVQHLVWSSLPNTLEQSGGAIDVPHFVSKGKVDTVIKELGFKYATFSMCAFYFQNITNPYLHFTELGEGGEVVFAVPMKPEAFITGFDVTDTGPAVLAIFDNPEEWNGKHVALAGTHAPAAEYAAVFEKVKKRKAVFKTVPPANEELGVMFKWFEEKTYYGDYDISTGRKCYPKLKTWEEWLEAQSWDGPH